MKTKSKEKDWVDRKVEDIESWGILTLMIHLRGIMEDQYKKERNVLFFNQGRDNEYYGSPLEVFDTLSMAVRMKFDEEITKLEKLKEQGVI